MHILILPSWYPSENEPIQGIFFREQSQALKRFGYQVGVIFIHFLSIRSLSFYKFKQYKSLKYLDDYQIPSYQSFSFGFLCRLPVSLFLATTGIDKIFQDYIQNFGIPDVIHAHSALMGGLIAWNLKNKYNIPYVITEHNTIYYEIEKLSRLDLSLSRKIFFNANYRIVVSQHLGETLENYFGDSFKPWFSIPNMLDSQFVQNEEIDNEIENKIKLVPRKSSKFRFLCIALMNESKGHNLLIKTFDYEFKNINNVELYLAGNGDYLESLQLLVKQLALDDKVFFLGLLERKQIVKELLSCDVLVLPSEYETFGVVLIEAFACGKPVICTAVGGSQFLINNNNGLVVFPRNQNTLAKSMRYMYNNIHQYNSQKIRQDSISMFSEDVIIQKLSKLYNSLI